MTEPDAALDHWLAKLASELRLPAGAIDRTLLLDLARDAAHNIARPAAPLTTFAVGLAAGLAARDGGNLPEVVRRLCADVTALAVQSG